MTSPTSPPTRRRRRVVVTVAVLVLGIGWWFWPRVDQRFVGKWELIPAGSPANYSPWIWVLRNDGTGEIILPDKKHEAEFGWRGDDKSFSWSGPLRMPTVVLQWFYFEQRLNGKDFVYDIVDETEGSITLRSPRPLGEFASRSQRPSEEFTLRRVSE